MVDSLSYLLFQPVLNDWCSKSRGMCYPVCWTMHIKRTLGKSSPCGFFYMHHPTNRTTHTTTFDTPVVEHWLDREIRPPWEIDPTTHRTMSERSNHGATSRSYLCVWWQETHFVVENRICSKRKLIQDVQVRHKTRASTTWPKKVSAVLSIYLDSILLILLLKFNIRDEGKGKGNVLFNDALNTFYLRLYGVRHMVKDIQIAREETRCRHMGYSLRLTARVLLYAPSHRLDSTYHGLCYTSRGSLAGTRNSSMGPHHGGSIRRPIAPWANILSTELHLASTFEMMRSTI